ncbi:putative uncharacterized protein [Clostridium sp. CAG:1193]|nr:putative uncharacterized protein [Clostridium sp. CAG:1193]
MNIKFYLYILVVPFVIWTMVSLNLEGLFKKNHVNQIKLFYVFVSLSISYLVVNFLYDFYLVSQIIK